MEASTGNLNPFLWIKKSVYCLGAMRSMTLIKLVKLFLCFEVNLWCL
jgi:hypothetical protein